jgi:hypothetical protein
MKAKYEVYEIGSSVWGISRYWSDGKQTDHCSIYQAKVKAAYLQTNTKTNSVDVEYWLETPDGQEWGCEVSADCVSDSFEELVLRMKLEWTRNSNTMGED